MVGRFGGLKKWVERSAMIDLGYQGGRELVVLGPITQLKRDWIDVSTIMTGGCFSLKLK